MYSSCFLHAQIYLSLIQLNANCPTLKSQRSTPLGPMTVSTNDRSCSSVAKEACIDHSCCSVLFPAPVLTPFVWNPPGHRCMSVLLLRMRCPVYVEVFRWADPHSWSPTRFSKPGKLESLDRTDLDCRTRSRRKRRTWDHGEVGSTLTHQEVDPSAKITPDTCWRPSTFPSLIRGTAALSWGTRMLGIHTPIGPGYMRCLPAPSSTRNASCLGKARAARWRWRSSWASRSVFCWCCENL